MIKERKLTLEQRVARLEKSLNKKNRSRTFESYAEAESVIDSTVACAERLRDGTREFMSIQKQLASLQRSGAFNDLSPEDMEAIEEKEEIVDSCLQFVINNLL